MSGSKRYAPLELHHEEPGYCVAACAYLLVGVWGRPATGADLEILSKVQRALVSTYGYCEAMSIIRVNLSLSVSDEVREGARLNVEEFGAVNRGSATVVEAGGVRAAFHRSIVASLQMLTFSPMPQKVTNSITDALAWLVARDGINARELGSIPTLERACLAMADEFGELPR